MDEPSISALRVVISGAKLPGSVHEAGRALEVDLGILAHALRGLRAVSSHKVPSEARSLARQAHEVVERLVDLEVVGHDGCATGEAEHASRPLPSLPPLEPFSAVECLYIRGMLIPSDSMAGIHARQDQLRVLAVRNSSVPGTAAILCPSLPDGNAAAVPHSQRRPWPMLHALVLDECGLCGMDDALVRSVATTMRRPLTPSPRPLSRLRRSCSAPSCKS